MDNRECLAYLFKLIKDGTFMEQVKADPWCVARCMLGVAALIMDRLNPHDHEPAFGDDATLDEEIMAVSDAIGVKSFGGPFDVILSLLIQRLIAEAQRIINEWLSEQQD